MYSAVNRLTMSNVSCRLTLHCQTLHQRHPLMQCFIIIFNFQFVFHTIDFNQNKGINFLFLTLW